MKKISSALISVYHKDKNLEAIIRRLHQLEIKLYSTGGTCDFIHSLDIPVTSVEEMTTYPSILGGRVKTLHPKVFGGILARREDDHIAQLEKYDIPEIDLVIVDLYPFEETVANTTDENTIIEKIDIGGISLIRAAAKNYKDVVIVPSRSEYPLFLTILNEKNGFTEEADRRNLALCAFEVSSHYDAAIYQYFSQFHAPVAFKASTRHAKPLRYGENPHQKAIFYGDVTQVFDYLAGKELSYNNLIDVEAALGLIQEFWNDEPCFAILKHNNACGVAVRSTLSDAWKDALAGDPVSAFGGVLVCNKPVDEATATEINKLFFEVLIAPDFEAAALVVLQKNKNRILLKLKSLPTNKRQYRSLLNGVIVQDTDNSVELPNQWTFATEKTPTTQETNDLIFAIKCVKHLKSNAVAIVKNNQLVGMGCGQTSRIDALEHALHKAKEFGLDLTGAVMASEAFFPFPDCVEIAHKAGIAAVAQPGGSIKDQLSIDYANQHQIAMIMTGVRHFKH